MNKGYLLLEEVRTCLSCKHIRFSRGGFAYCKAGKTPESCRRMKRRPKSQSGKKIGREVVLRGDEEVD